MKNFLNAFQASWFDKINLSRAMSTKKLEEFLSDGRLEI
jgi:hypothetical protein